MVEYSTVLLFVCRGFSKSIHTNGPPQNLLKFDTEVLLVVMKLQLHTLHGFRHFSMKMDLPN